MTKRVVFGVALPGLPAAIWHKKSLFHPLIAIRFPNVRPKPVMAYAVQKPALETAQI